MLAPRPSEQCSNTTLPKVVTQRWKRNQINGSASQKEQTAPPKCVELASDSWTTDFTIGVGFELVSVGSAAHRTGTCKPCAFLHTKGCASGFDCQFCHLCGPDEKKRRQKAKRMYFHQLRAAGGGVLDGRHFEEYRQHSGNFAATDMVSDDMNHEAPLSERSTQSPESETHSAISTCRPSALRVLDGRERPYVVRNTFIETQFGADSLLDGDVPERAVTSCPASKVGAMQLTVQTQFDDAETPSTEDVPLSVETPQSIVSTPWPSTPEPIAAGEHTFPPPPMYQPTNFDFAATSLPVEMQSAMQPGAINQYGQMVQLPYMEYSSESWQQSELIVAPHGQEIQQVQALTDFQCAAPLPFQCHAEASMQLQKLSIPPPPVEPPVPPVSGASAGTGSRILSLADVIETPSRPLVAVPDIGSDAFMNIGSKEHATGNCKPCGFFHKSGCSAGATCSYCHLCDPGEKKRRQREKREALRAAVRCKDRRYALALGGA